MDVASGSILFDWIGACSVADDGAIVLERAWLRGKGGNAREEEWRESRIESGGGAGISG